MTKEPPPAVLSEDFDTASRALATAIKDRDVEAVNLALGNRSLILRREAAEALAKVGDKTSVPCLIDALEKNQAVYTGGTETKALQIKLNAALISALEKRTEVDFGKPDPSSKEDLARVLRMSREWWAKNKE